jgi:antitoxin CptB
MQEGIEKKVIEDSARIAWACRRGMLELDVLLNNFLKEAYPDLPREDKILFVQLLGYSDPELFAWLMGLTIPSEEKLMKITDILRQHARTKLLP